MHEFKFDTDEFQLEGDIDFSKELQIADVLSEFAPIVIATARSGLRWRGVPDPVPSQIMAFIKKYGYGQCKYLM